MPLLYRRQYQEFRIGSDGGLSGVGMMIAQDPGSGKMVVLAPIKGSPADQAGIQPGDEVSGARGVTSEASDGADDGAGRAAAGWRQEARPAQVLHLPLPQRKRPTPPTPPNPPSPQLLNVDGTSISGLDTDRVAQRLRGPADTSVWVKVARRQVRESSCRPAPPTPAVGVPSATLQACYCSLAAALKAGLMHSSRPAPSLRRRFRAWQGCRTA